MSAPDGVLQRLDKILSNSGAGSRSDVKQLIRSGAVTCDGVVVKNPEAKFSAEKTRFAVDGAELRYGRFAYIMMNKPKGVVCATFDTRHKTVADLLPPTCARRGMFPVGRLDIDTTGLVLLTDDGPLAHRLLSPKNHVEKEYVAVLDRPPDPGVFDAFARGVVIDGNIKLRPAKLSMLVPSSATGIATETASDNSPEAAAGISAGTSPGAAVSVAITEGKFHQIKKMFAVFGIAVLELKRVRMGSLRLDPELPPGGSRELASAELSPLLSQPKGAFQ